MEGFAAIVVILTSLLSITKAADTITAAESIKDGETLISSDGSFEMGFFSPGNSKNRYVGIWYQISVATVVWVANREIPLDSTSGGVLKVISPGILLLVNANNNSTIWSSNNTSTYSSESPVAQLLDSGNLVVRDAANNDSILWQSFDYPADTQLPGMQLGKSFVTGVDRYLSSWKSNDDPAPGEFTYHCDPTGYPQMVLEKGSIEQYRSGPWNGLTFTGMLSSTSNTIYKQVLVVNEREVYYSFELQNSTVISRTILNQYGTLQLLVWVYTTHEWVVYLNWPTDICDNYSLCGPNGMCNIVSSPVCGCLDKFAPKYAGDWLMNDWSGGCTRNRNTLRCNSTDGFLKLADVKLPDTRSSWFSDFMTLMECEASCLTNCSCMAYANSDIRGSRSGCLLWFGDLIDIRKLNDAGQDIYVRMVSSELDLLSNRNQSSRRKGKIIKLSVPISVGLALLGFALTVYVRKKKTRSQLNKHGCFGHESRQDEITNESQKEDLELPLYGLSTIANATNNFSIHNMLGEGGFGPVYKGLLEGQEIAVKRLSKTSSQGVHEFKNEVICIAKLQHRNLVKLLGYCIQGDEKMLIYEFMPNNSLERFIFDETQSKLLDWPKRFNIIDGIARGLLYLHRDSRLRIIHRDLKASNVLLDSEMNPKISDFGLARSFGGNETEANTRRVVGTYGYISPEYAVHGTFSVKSDVFSFGVLVLEIVSGKRNRKFVHPDHCHNLLGHAWKLHKEGRSLELMDAPIGDTCYICQVRRSIQVGLLCVQQHPQDRPSMSSVVMMLASDGTLPQPKQPGFFTDERATLEAKLSTLNAPTSNNEVTMTALDGR